MTKLQIFLRDSLIYFELLCAVVAIIKYSSLKGTHWKWFSVYVVMIFIFEIISYTIFDFFPNNRRFYFEFLVIPFQYLFFYWLYAVKSLNSKKTFYFVVSIYVIVFSITHFFYPIKTRIINEVSYSTGGFLLFFLVVLEFLRQIKSDEIIYFSKNKMFYINIGVALFYVGTLPFFAFDGFAVEKTKELWNNYWTIFLSLNCVTYLIFTASFIWGKPHSI